MTSLAIIGIGNIGIRHLESILKTKSQKSIFIFDLDQRKLANAEDLFRKNKNDLVKLTSISKYSDLPKNLDFLILATPSLNRISILKKIKSNIKHLIVEKVLASSKSELEYWSNLQKSNDSIYVNLPYFYEKIFNYLSREFGEINEVTFEGSEINFACNLVHYLDILEKLFDKEIQKLKINHSDLNWCESKRNGFYETLGNFSCFIDNKKINFISNKNYKYQLRIILKTNAGIVEYDWETGLIELNKKTHRRINIKYQSERSLDFINKLTSGKKPDISNLEKAIRLHHFLIDILSPSWELFCKSKTDIKFDSKKLLIT